MSISEGIGAIRHVSSELTIYLTNSWIIIILSKIKVLSLQSPHSIVFKFKTSRSLYIIYVTAGGGTGTLDGLVGLHTRLAIYPALTICYQRVVICALLNTGFKGTQVVTYPANIKQLKSHWQKVPQKGLGTCIWINKSHNPFWLCSTPWEALR